MNAEQLEQWRKDADDLAARAPMVPFVGLALDCSAAMVALLSEVERLTQECDEQRAQTDAIADEWQRENDMLNACRAERDAWQQRSEATDVDWRNEHTAWVRADEQLRVCQRERDALAAELAQVREELSYAEYLYEDAIQEGEC